MTSDFVHELLYEDESATLDFKRDQYAFVGATDEQKSEIVKDILAFANAWRRTTAYILIGVDEVKGGKSQVLGVGDHLDEASLQQLVNSKTNRPIEFSYKTIVHEGRSLGVISVPVQERPIFVNKDFGKLRANFVYVRRGSSTAIADPDEVSRMGAAAVADVLAPIIDLQFGDPDKRKLLGGSLEVESFILSLPEKSLLPQLSSQWGLSFFNSEYYREYADYLEQYALLQPLGFVLSNIGSTLAANARLEIECNKNTSLVFSTFRPHPPAYETYNSLTNLNFAVRDQLHAEEYGDHWSLTAGFGSVQPKAREWTGKIYVGARDTVSVHLAARIYADNLQSPVEVPLAISVKSSSSRTLSVVEFVDYVDKQRKR
jgi:hypothetical protein